MSAESAIIRTLRASGVEAKVAEVTTGASVDRYALELTPGTRVADVTRLAPEIALATSALDVRIAPIPGTAHVGVELPAAEPYVVTLEALQADLSHDHPLRFPVGQDVSGATVVARLDRLPHLLVAGTTGSGKSVFTTSLLAHLVTHADPRQVQLALIDPKRVELAPFARVPHLVGPPAVETEDAILLLDSAVDEMEQRYDAMQRAGARSIGEMPSPPPYLVVVVDELADLMMTGKKRAEDPIVRILQKGRAAGIHMILATQRPSADVVTGLIKANTPSRMVFAVKSHTDSGVALGQSGAQTLLGHGDGLWWPGGSRTPERVQAPYLSTEELAEMLAPMERDEVYQDVPDGAPSYADAAEGPPAYAPPRDGAVPTMAIHDEVEWVDDNREQMLEDARLEGYEIGLANAAALNPGPSRKRRLMRASDWWLAIGLGILLIGVASAALPALPLIAGVGGTYYIIRRRLVIQHYGRSET